jgi:hypothetical protein
MQVTLMLEISSIICFAPTRVVFVPEECASVDHYFPVTGRYPFGTVSSLAIKSVVTSY